MAPRVKYRKNGRFSKAEFIDSIRKVTEVESIRGAKYLNIKLTDNTISGFRDSTKGSFDIDVNSLYTAYTQLDTFTTTSLKRFVSGVQSPSLAILIAANLILPNKVESI